VPNWGFLANHALVLLCIARDPGVRLRDIAATAIVKEKGGCRNRYRVEADRPLLESAEGISPSGTCWPSSGGSDAGLPGTEREPG